MAKKKKLLKLADLLDRVPEDQFDMATWAMRYDSGAECASVACALGWATTIFPDLVLVRSTRFDGMVVHTPTITDGERAAMNEFGMTFSDAWRMFCTEFGRGPREVAEDLRSYVRTGTW